MKTQLDLPYIVGHIFSITHKTRVRHFISEYIYIYNQCPDNLK